MALYEYHCSNCGTRTEKRMPMSDVLQAIPCPHCNAQAKKVMGGWTVTGRAAEGVGDGPAPWDSGGGDGGDAGGMPDLGGHGHSHGPGGHSHGPGGHSH